MKSIQLSLVLLGASLVAPLAQAADSLNERIDTAVNILQTLNAADKSVPPSILENCAGVAIVKIARGGFIIGGSHGNGVVLKHMGGGNWSAPAAFEMGGGSFGAQIGGDVVDYVFVLNNELALEMFTSNDEVKFDAGASATAGPDHAAANKKDLPGKSIYVYSNTDGAFAGATVGGSFIEVQPEVNQAAYGADITTSEILSGKVEAPASTEKLVELLNQE